MPGLLEELSAVHVRHGLYEQSLWTVHSLPTFAIRFQACMRALKTFHRLWPLRRTRATETPDSSQTLVYSPALAQEEKGCARDSHKVETETATHVFPPKSGLVEPLVSPETLP